MQNDGKKWIVPPGLVSSFREFEAHFEVSEGDPIMITGASGVGKSLFLYQFKTLFGEKQKRDKHGKGTVLHVNCAQFDGADANVARSELFGHKKDAFTGATQDKAGLIAQANGGALILEEIGDLPKPTQALLLDFLETGEFREVGGKEIKKSNVQVVGATNRPERLREDLLYRFFPFHIPSLYERRMDVLWYILCVDPDIFRSLKVWEILLLISYNWPGNVREVKRVVKLLKRWRALNSQSERKPKYDRDIYRLYELGEQNTSLSGMSLADFRRRTEKSGINLESLDRILMSSGLGIDPECNDTPLNREGFYIYYEDNLNNRYKNLEAVELVEDFDLITDGFQGFCALQWRSFYENENILSEPKERWAMPFFPAERYFDKKLSDDVRRLALQFYNALPGVKGSADRVPKDLEGHVEILNRAKAPGSHDGFLPWKEAEARFKRQYFQDVLARADGNQSKAARLAQVDRNTLLRYIDKSKP